ncbi:conserved protein of unknown function [Acidithiobacillus ferrivorans]|uniref:Uncharacterized protein n=1 Tax=Acidithiobacillus ferrivorans TaxID=160808 RepID=A0A060UVM8_9PROT|nr:hypothetical protein [Acidithiobacillus ferrivorans]CDQ10604.1 conserved hypothetical protein [Acidithiobacillus ferrivorans]SMH64635.1 conserved protein of unknown function [Acidithiobacillus ferrivorans]
MNKVDSPPRPLFLQRIHEREAAEKRKAEEERKCLTLLALDVALVVLKANQRRPDCRHHSRPRKKDIWSHIGDFVFGDF